MSYQLKHVTDEIISHVGAHSSDLQRGKNQRHFEDNAGFSRVATNPTNGCYLLRAPARAMESGARFYFFFAQQLFEVYAENHTPGVIRRPGELDDGLREAFKAELAEAFSVFRYYGHPEEESVFNPVFEW